MKKHNLICFEFNKLDLYVLSFLKNKGFKYIARDKCDCLYAYKSLPLRKDWTDEWVTKKENWQELPIELFASIKWEHDPLKIEDYV